MPTILPEIRDFLALRRIALVGTSRDPKDLSRVLLREMCARGYDMVPVNPAAEGHLEDMKCFARVQDIQPSVEGALVMTSSRDSKQVVQDCVEAGIRSIWLYRGGGQGSVTPEAVEFCREHDIHVIEGHCPFMFLSHTQFVHRLHGFILKLTGAYPRETRRAA
jgi:predicted CoA-binding protein